MEEEYIQEKTFDKNDFTQTPLKTGEYENCTFLHCNFSKSDVSKIYFSACEFKGCNLSMAALTKTAIRDIKFTDCKMLGLQFNTCNEFLFTVAFENCILNYSTFYKLKLKKTKFKNSSLHDVDFTEADLSSSVFDNCDLTRATFQNTIVEQVDFRTSFNYSIDPEINRIKKARFSLTGLPGLLEKYDIKIETP